MKKILVLSMLFVAGLFATELQAQELKLGAKAGVNFSDLKGPSNTDMKTSYHIGLFVEYFFNEEFAIQPEVIYSSQGAKESYEGMKTTGTFDYLHVPSHG